MSTFQIGLKSVRARPIESRTAMEAHDTLTPMETIEGKSKSSCKLQPPSLKRIVLNPRAYMMPFVLFIIFHDLPMLLAFGFIDKPEGYNNCDRLQDLFLWLRVAFILHLILACMMLTSVVYTLTTRVYHERRPEGWLILSIFVGYWVNLGWSLYGEAAMRVDTSVCGDFNWEQIQDRADSISYFQHFDFVFSVVIVMVGACTSYMCGVHSGDDAAEAEKRWQKRCMCCFHAFTCHKTVEYEGDDDVFETLGRVLGKFFVVRYKTNRYEGLSFTDLKFSLDLVSKVQKKERELETEKKAQLAAQGIPTVQHFAPEEEEKRLNDLAFYCRLAIGIYGWPIYVWYSPCYWFHIFGCFKKPQEEQIFEHDNFLHGNRATFVRYTGVKDSDLVYLNCFNFVFQAPYCIVKDKTRKELIISVRGSMSFYDFVTDGLAQIVRMDPNELPDDIPYSFDTRTHYGMLQTARQIFKSLQEDTRKTVFWDFAMAHCSVKESTADESTDWKIVVCGHSMGAGVGCILAILLRKVFTETKAFLYAVPPLFDPETAAWTKQFATTAVYGDDIVPRLSIANMTRLRDEMAVQYDAVANEPLYKVTFGIHDKLIKSQQERQASADSVSESDAAVSRLPTVLETANSFHTGNSTVSSGSFLNNSSMGLPTPTDFGSTRNVITRPSRELSNNTMISLPQEDSSQEVDVPGEIVHIQTVKMARRCGCTVFLGEQKMQYTLQDASYFRRIWVTPRSLQDHMVHHYDRKIRYLVTDCMDFETPVAAHRPSVSARVSWVDDTDHDNRGNTPQTDYEKIETVA
ncbi:sn1-specific diacylglycerol lipase beta-like [Plasmopara halstedii]|uniref:sn-1-specific diacylglycerol lipase n=1 Tax=Plasmopara halstedii TaxID=4781 RepID=A0A0P1ABX4_PLAHL|nr:sn1-specific diacylglycerol lipase beta-like [Plasmopara halstedii]CEG38172.1 sn1-specific diacylglycerol lipase beta-like [Plasmopara halstedii]|eukprot:XP_024574541.1 sn1-specific diacylglycerol lipase beta-like [Plasmopara halstedii]